MPFCNLCNGYVENTQSALALKDSGKYCSWRHGLWTPWALSLIEMKAHYSPLKGLFIFSKENQHGPRSSNFEIAMPIKVRSSSFEYFKLDQYRVEYQVPTFTMATVFVNSPGDLSKPAHLALMDRMVDDFEHLPGSWGPVGTMYFVRDFIKFENSMEGYKTHFNL